MSSISGVSASSNGWLQQLQTQAAGTTSSTSSTSATSSTEATSTRPHRHGGGDRGAKFTKALEDQGITGTKLSDLRSQIESAMKDAKASGGDPKSAIDGVLKAAGVDMDAFKAEMKPPSGGAGGTPTDPDGDGDSSTSTTASSPSATPSATNVLTANGLDPTQFQSSLMALLDSGSTDTSSLFSNAAVGSSLDIAA